MNSVSQPLGSRPSNCTNARSMWLTSPSPPATHTLRWGNSNSLRGNRQERKNAIRMIVEQSGSQERRERKEEKQQSSESRVNPRYRGGLSQGGENRWRQSGAMKHMCCWTKAREQHSSEHAHIFMQFRPQSRSYHSDTMLLTARHHSITRHQSHRISSHTHIMIALLVTIVLLLTIPCTC